LFSLLPDIEVSLTMKFAVCIALLALSARAEEAKSNPLGKVFELMSALETKIVKEGEAEAKAFKEFFDWCDSASQNLNNEIKTAKTKEEKLNAQIGELTSDLEVGTSKIEQLSTAISTNEAELSDATSVRNKEHADFAAAEKELVETVDTLDRAVSIISTEMSKNAAALTQIDTSNMNSLLSALGAVVEAAGFTTNDKQRLTALVQAHQSAEDSEAGAPAAATYKSQSGGIVDVLEDLKEKADGELAEARKAESSAKHNFDMMKQSLEDQMAADTKDMNEEKAAKEAAEEGKATAEGDLASTVKALKEAEDGLATTHGDCMTTAADHEATVAARNEELKVIATAEKILKDSTSGAVEQTYSFLQVAASSKMTTRTDLANSEVVTLVKKLARDHHSAALAQLASRISVVARYGTKDGANPFGKIKGLISDMITKLEKEAEAEATEKAYCDEQMAKTEAKKAELDGTIAKLTNKIDRNSARSASLKEEVAELQAELAALAKTQSEMDKIRSEENANYRVAKAVLTQGLEGVRKALSVLRDYYGGSAALLQDDAKFSSFMQQPAPPQQHDKAGGAGGSIINILEVCESDFANNLAKEETEESDSASEYEKTTQENKVSKATKEQDAKYKGQEATSLDKEIAELSSDRDTSNSELSAVLEYYGKIKERCIAKPETYEERKARREAEIEGLKNALSILENETAFMQRGRKGAKGRHARFMA
jgi:chromosome segregation ATPase